MAVRRAADRLEATAARSGYRRRRQLDHPPDAEALVAAATARARDGDDDALRLLYLLYADNVFGYVLAIVHDEHDAEDITSEVFARLPRALTHYQVSATPFAAWLLRVARNAALDHLRAQRSVPLAEVRAPRRDAELHAHERLDDLRAALEALPDRPAPGDGPAADRRAHARPRSPSGSAARSTPSTPCSTAPAGACARSSRRPAGRRRRLRPSRAPEELDAARDRPGDPALYGK